MKRLLRDFEKRVKIKISFVENMPSNPKVGDIIHKGNTLLIYCGRDWMPIAEGSAQ